MAEPSVAENTPPMMPPMTTMIRDREGRARRVQTPRFFQSNLPEMCIRDSYKTAFIFNRDDHISPHVPSWAIRAVLTTDNIRLLEPQKTRTEEDTESWI